MSQLSSTFTGDMKTPPTPKAGNDALHYPTPALNKPNTNGVLGQTTCVELPMSPASLASPMGTAIPNVGHKA